MEVYIRLSVLVGIVHDVEQHIGEMHLVGEYLVISSTKISFQ